MLHIRAGALPTCYRSAGALVLRLPLHAEAERLYRQIARSTPNDFDAQHLFGVLNTSLW